MIPSKMVHGPFGVATTIEMPKTRKRVVQRLLCHKSKPSNQF